MTDQTCTTCNIEWLGRQPLNADSDCPVCALDKVIEINGPVPADVVGNDL